jgi:hypothetical protein
VTPSATGGTNATVTNPNATSGTHTAAVTPNADNATTVSPNANTVPERAVNPDTQDISDHARVDPNQ